MNNFKRLSSWILMLALVLCFTVAFASCGYVDEPADTPNACAHADGNNDHKCDTCGEVTSQCSNKNKDHKCDLCGAVMSQCADDDKDHYCDVCGSELTECEVDNNPVDHKCDVCGAVLGSCADNLGNDHKCDHCGAVLTQCNDGNNDHKCDTCKKVLTQCEDGNDADHKCDACGKSMCFDNTGDGNCDECGDPLCYDNNNDCVCDDCSKPMHNDDNDDHLCDRCNTKVSDCSDVTTDTDHNCDVCQKNLCTDANGDYVCDGCGAQLARITANLPAPMCFAKNTTNKVVQVTDPAKQMDFTPVYTGGAYIVDFWVVYDSEGKVFMYVENGSKFKTNVAGTYTVLPVFIANNTTGVSDNDLTLEMSDGTSTAAPDNSCITPAWADSELSKKLIKVGSGSNGYMVSDATDAQMYVTVDPTDAANTVLLWAVNSNTTGGMGNSLVTAAVDPASKGTKIVVSFDYNLDYLYSAAGIGTMVYLTDSEGAQYCIARLLTVKGTEKFSGTENNTTPIEGALILKTLLNTSTPASHKHGAGSVNLNSDTWYTITIEIDTTAKTSAVYYALRGGERTLLGKEEVADFDASKIISLTFSQGFFNNRQISLLDNIVAKRVHECVDAGEDHVCDVCSVKLCADGDDADHNCDTCGDSLCFDGDIPDHKCEVCGASSECVDNNKDHLCDICATRKFGGDCADGTDADHNCDYCNTSLCADLTNDHKCDECGATVSECVDASKDHLCDICGATLTQCSDVAGDMDHKCDVCGKDGVSECEDGDDEGHRCDDCGKTLCADANNDGTCDVCGLHTCFDVNTDGICDGCKAMTFTTDVTAGVDLFSFTQKSSSTAGYAPINQTSITEGDPYNASNPDASSAAKFGTRAFRTTDPDNAANSVLCVVINENTKAGTSNSGNVSTLGFDPKVVVAGGNVHIVEFDLNVQYYAKNEPKNAFQVVAIDEDGTRYQIQNADKAYGATIAFSNSVTAPTKNAFSIGAGHQANEISTQINLDSHTWYRIRITFNQTTGAVFYDVSFDKGNTWYLAQADGKNFGTGLDGVEIAKYGFQFNCYNLGGTFLFDNIVYTVTDTVPTRPTELGTDAVEHGTN